MTARKSASAAKADDTTADLVENPTQITEAPADEGTETDAAAPGAGTYEDTSWNPEDDQSADHLPGYPTDSNGVPEVGTQLYPGDDIEFVLQFLAHLAPEQFDRAKQRFMQDINDERSAA